MPGILGAIAWCLVLATVAVADTASWTPAAWTKLDTLELLTDVPGDGPYAFPVWLVVLDGEVYVRLGRRAAQRVEGSADARIGVAVGGSRFQRVRCEPVPDLAPRVAAAIAEKYWSDVFIRYVPHPLTCRLIPE